MRWLLTLFLLLAPLTAHAQDDRDWLTAFLEDNLSGDDRHVKITGFAGAFSSKATFDELTVADSEGIWLRVTEGAMALNRSALLSGRVEITELSAAEIIVARKPVADTAPSPEATAFTFPELPVSVLVEGVKAGRVSLGEALFGQAVVGTITGAAKLEAGEGTADIAISRRDGVAGDISLKAAFNKATGVLSLDLLASEAKGGIAATLIGLPGAPAVTLAVNGSGPIDNFRADLALTTDGKSRLKGAVTLTGAEVAGEGVTRAFKADLVGDVAPLFWPEYQEFFGPEVRLLAEGSRTPNGEMALQKLELEAQALTLSGDIALAANGLPRHFALDVQLGHTDGTPVLLPLAGEKTTLRSAKLTATYDAREGDGWTLAGDLRGLVRPEAEIAALRLNGSGRINAATSLVGGTLEFVAAGLAPRDPALARAVGPTLSGRAIFYRTAGDALSIPKFRAIGQGYSAQGGLRLAGFDTGLTVSGHMDAQIRDIARLSDMLGRDLAGQAEARVSGSFALLSGAFDVQADVQGTDLATAQPELDRLLKGASTLAVSATRGPEGIEIRSLNLAAQTLRASTTGWLRSTTSEINANLDFSDLSVLGGPYSGAMQAEAELRAEDGVQSIALKASAKDLGVGQAQADLLLRGTSDLSLRATLRGEKLELEAFDLRNPQLTASATGQAEGATRRLDLSARLADLALFAPGFSGPLTVTGTASEEAGGYRLDLAGNGPGGTDARVEGTVAYGFGSVDLAISGGAQAASVNTFIAPRSLQGPVRFDLRMAGRPALSTLTGTAGLSGGRLVAPLLGVTLEGIDATAQLAGGAAELSLNAGVQGGGTVSVRGPVQLTPPFDANLRVALARARLRDPALYTTTVDGDLAISGPLTGGARVSGALTLGETEVRVPSTGLGASGELPDITHIAEPAAVRATRASAGLIGGASQSTSSARPLALDITLSAPRRIFVRGRGLDAELGGALRLGGTTANIIPSGQFDLVRGRLDILGKRFTLDEGLVQLQGGFLPFIRFAASTQAEGVTATLTISGVASEPAVTFSSAPSLPEEEILALLLFGRGLTTLSPLQAAQLASAVATLAGKGGEGIVSRLRKSFGLDDLDVTTSDDGTAAVRAGKYISENIYTDVVIGSDGKSEINLNLDVSPSLTARGTLGSDGQTGLGIYYEKDY